MDKNSEKPKTIGIRVEGGENPTIEGNYLVGLDEAIVIKDSKGGTIRKNIIKDKRWLIIPFVSMLGWIIANN